MTQPMSLDEALDLLGLTRASTDDAARSAYRAHASVLDPNQIHGMTQEQADRLVAEVNQGGDLVESVVRQIDPLVPFRALRAARGKSARAEPVAALYEQGRVKHLRHGHLGQLEDQMCRMTVAGYEGRGSPDRVDALVWALWELLLGNETEPHVRAL